MMMIGKQRTWAGRQTSKVVFGGIARRGRVAGNMLLNLSRNNYNFLFQTAIIKVTIINYHRFNLEAIKKGVFFNDRQKEKGETIN